MKPKLYLATLWTSLLYSHMAYGQELVVPCPDIREWNGVCPSLPNGWECSQTPVSKKKQRSKELVFQRAQIFDVKTQRPAQCTYADKTNPSESVLILQNSHIQSGDVQPSYKFRNNSNTTLSDNGAYCQGNNIDQCIYELIPPTVTPPLETVKPTPPPPVVTPSPAPAVIPLQPIKPAEREPAEQAQKAAAEQAQKADAEQAAAQAAAQAAQQAATPPPQVPTQTGP